MNLKRIGDNIIDYVKDDLTHWYSLSREVSVKVYGEDITELFGKQERMVCVGKLTIWSDTTGNTVTLTAHPFKADEKLWNGPNVVPNSDYESMLASLFHDLMYEYVEEIARQINKPEKAVRKWADDLLYSVWAGSTDSKWERFKARIGYGVCRVFGGIFHKIGSLFLLLILAYLLSGCCVPHWNLVSVEGSDAITEVINGDK